MINGRFSNFRVSLPECNFRIKLAITTPSAQVLLGALLPISAAEAEATTLVAGRWGRGRCALTGTAHDYRR